ncbi:hypothetical protein [Limnohabitans sp.]|uniref:hypothetical protein n=1 Tax=Limnohabitans sp. TaxID=1907725 RepID=UPI0038B95075
MSTIHKAFLLTAACLFWGVHAARAQDPAHPNSVEITRGANAAVNFSFALNLPQLLHRMLAPKSTYAAFLQAQVELPDPALERELSKVSASWSERAFFTLPSGAKVFLKQWQLPDAQSLRDAFKTSLILLNLPPKTAVHADPMVVTAMVQPKTPVSRAQLQLPAAMHPLWVVLKTDKFWLTDQIPMAIVELD